MDFNIKGIGKRARERIQADGWHAGTLATAWPSQLTKYGISNTAAQELIDQARRLVNQAGLAASLAAMPAEAAPLPPPPTVEDLENELRRLSPDEPIPPMSVRLKRIWINKRLAELRGQ